MWDIRILVGLVLAGGLVSSACGGADPAEVAHLLDNLEDPSSDVQFLFGAIEREEAACMAEKGFADYNVDPSAGAVSALSATKARRLPEIVEFPDGKLGYEERIARHFDEDELAYLDYDGMEDVGEGVPPTEDEIAVNVALMGERDDWTRVEVDAPFVGAVGQVIGGCIEVSYRLLSEDEVSTYIAGAMTATNLPSRLQQGALEEMRTETDAWSACMAENGLEVAHPFKIAVTSPYADQAVVAAADKQCREAAGGLDEIYGRQFFNASGRTDGDVVPVLRNLQALASSFRDRFDES